MERYALIDLETREYQTFSEYELKNGLVGKRWLKAKFISPLIVFKDFFDSDSHNDSVVKIIENAGCGQIQTCPLNDFVFKPFGRIIDEDVKMFEISESWDDWAERHNLDDLERGRIFGIGLRGAKMPTYKLCGIESLIEKSERPDFTFEDYLKLMFPIGWNPVRTKEGSYEKAFMNMKCKPFKPTEQWTFTKQIVKGKAFIITKSCGH